MDRVKVAALFLVLANAKEDEREKEEGSTRVWVGDLCANKETEGVSTISGIIPTTCRAIYMALKDLIALPNSANEWKEISNDYHDQWNFPNCLGAIDGKHIAIQKPNHAGSTYHNYKGYESLVLMAVVNANQKFLYVDVGSNGRTSDGGVWRQCGLNILFESGSANLPPSSPNSMPHVFIADEAFPLKPYLMKPYLRRIFNYHLSRARRLVENAFWKLAAMWRIFRAPINVEPEKVEQIVIAACTLQNFIFTHRSIPFSTDSDAYILNGSRRSESTNLGALQHSIAVNSSSEVARTIRDSFCDYFNGEGCVEWQE